MKRKVILFPITNAAFATRQLYWANSLKKKKTWEVIVFSFISEQSLITIANGKNMTLPSPIFYDINAHSFSLKIINRLSYLFSATRLTNKHLKVFFQTWHNILVLTQKRKEIQKLLKAKQVSAMMIPDSSPAYYAPILVAAAKKEKVLTLTNPLDRDNPLSYAMIYKSDLSLRLNSRISRSISKRIPKWHIRYDNIDMLRLTPDEILAQEYLKIAPDKPWNTFGFLEDTIIVSNKIQSDFFEQTGVSPQKIQMIGAPEHDYIFSLLRNKEEQLHKINTELQFVATKPILVCALPQTHWIAGRIEAEFQDHQEMINVWIDILSSQTKYNVIISLHPSMPYEQYLYIERPNIKVAKRDILELIPLCSIFVACLSSTIQYALSLGKPVVNYDVYRYSQEIDYLAFSEGKGTVTVLNQEDFRKVIKSISEDETYIETLKAKQLSTAQQWGQIDGQAIERFVHFLDNSILNN